MLLINIALSKVVFAQGIQGVGITIGGTRSNQKWNYQVPDIKVKQKYINGFNGSFFLEYLNNDYIRLITEIQFNQKGTKDNQVTNKGAKYRLNYFSFNNFLKIRQEGYDYTPYFLIGPRLEYLFTSNHILPMRPLHVSMSMGAGCEFMFWSPWVPFIELNFNPDLMKAYTVPTLDIKNKAFELRAGFKYVIGPAHNCPKAMDPAGGLGN